MIRAQLAVPDSALVDAKTYNQLFTMHGTVMMLLFAVPIVEAIAVYLLPSMPGARDLPFPRLLAYAFWAYAIGDLAFFCKLFFGDSPDGGWLTSRIERGLVSPSVESLDRIAAALGVPVSRFLGDQPSRTDFSHVPA